VYDGKPLQAITHSVTPAIAEPDARTINYTWKSPGHFRLTPSNTPTLRDIIEGLAELQHRLCFVLTLYTHEIKAEPEMYPVRFQLRVAIPGDTEPASIGELENSLGHIFPEAPLTPTYSQPDNKQPTHLVTRHASRLLTTVPAPGELHEQNLTVQQVPFDDGDLDNPEIYYDPTWSLPTPIDPSHELGRKTIGYGPSQLPITLLRIAENSPEVNWTDQPLNSHLQKDIYELSRLDQPLFIIDSRDNISGYYSAIKNVNPHAESPNIIYKPSDAFRPEFDRHKPTEASPALVNYLMKFFQYNDAVFFLDLSQSKSPVHDATTFYTALHCAIRRRREADMDPACSLVIDDAGVLIQDTLLQRIDASWPIPQEANITLQCRYPMGTSVGTTASSLNQTTATQATTLEQVMMTVADSTAIRNTPSTRKLLSQLDSSSPLTKELIQLSRTHNNDVTLWADKTAPSSDVVGSGLVPYSTSDTESLNPEAVDGFDHFINIQSMTIDWDKYTPESKTQSTTDTQNERASASGGPPSTRIARPQQTTNAQLPEGAVFDPDSDTYQCTACQERRNTVQSGLRRVCQCCSKSASHVDRAALRAIPPIEVKRSAAEIAESPCSEAQLVFLRACYLAKQFGFDPVFQFDPLTDSMQRLREDLGISAEAVAELTDMTVDGQGILTKQTTTTPHTVYNITATGRKLIAEALSDGIDFGPGIGDLNESMLHRIGVQYLCRYLAATYGQPANRTVQHYYRLPSGEVIDAVVLEEDTLVVAAEMECHNNDVGGADSSCRSTYQKLMNCDSTEAIWVFETGEHWSVATEELATAHRDPQSPIEFRDSGYSRSYISKDPTLEYPGMSAALTLASLLKTVDYPPSLYQRDHSQFYPD
jgi:hypothetical protein